MRWLAAARIGAIAIPLSTFSTSAELRTLLRNADIELLFATPSFRGRDYVDALREADARSTRRPLPPRHVATFDADALVAAGAALGDDDVLAAAEARVSPADRMVIVHTSGSTSEPKGVIHQHGPLIRHLDNLNALRRYTDDEVLFSNSPFFWIGGFAYGLLGTLLAGATLVCSNATDAGGDARPARAGPTDDGQRVRRVGRAPRERPVVPEPRSQFDPTRQPLADHARRRAPRDPELRHNMLGMTEAGSVCLASDDETDQPEHRRGSFGRPVPGFEAKVVDPETGVELDVGEVGELWLRGPFLMEGYYGRERHETFTADGWYRTGDLFHVDADGFFYFTGRRGDMIKTAGANVSPREVEAAIAEVTGLVAHVVGIDDPERGQLVAAAIRLPSGHAAPDADALRVGLRTKLSAYKVPQRYLVVADDDVPMLSSGKLDARAQGTLP